MRKIFQNFKIRHKLFGGFFVILFLATVMGWVAWSGMSTTSEHLDYYVDVIGQLGRLNEHSQASLLQARRREKDYMLRFKEVGFEEARTKYVSVVVDEIARVKQNLTEIEKIAPPDLAIQNDVDAMLTAVDTYETEFLKTVDLLEEKGHQNTGVIGQFRDKVHEIEGVVVPKGVDTLTIDMLMIRRHEKDYLLRGAEKYVTKIRDAVAQLKADTETAALTQSEKDEIIALADEYQTLFDRVVALDGQIAAQTQVFRDAAHQTEVLLQTVGETVVAREQMERTAIQEHTARTKNTVAVVVGLTLALGVALAFWLTKLISAPVVMVANAIENIATGDLDQYVELDSGDELGDMVRAFTAMEDYLHNIADVALNISQGQLGVDVTPRSEKDILGKSFRQMADNLRVLVGNVKKNVEDLHEVSHQLIVSSQQAEQAATKASSVIMTVAENSSNQHRKVDEGNKIIRQVSQAIEEVARGAQEQSEDLEQTVQLADRISVAIDQVAATVKEGVQLAAETAIVAHDGTEIIETTITGMQSVKEQVEVSALRVREMGERSGKIGGIVETIEDIAAQTNLLALNAAIEAARAGEHGKGFAVVADEVRKLAEKSAEAAGEIGALIKSIQQAVTEAVSAMEKGRHEAELGVESAAKSQIAIQDILKNVEAVRVQVEQIAEASEQINAASTEMTESMTGVSAVVEENTAAAEEMSAGASEVLEVTDAIARLSEASEQSVQKVALAANEIVDDMDQVTQMVEVLTTVTNELSQGISRFSLDDGNGDDWGADVSEEEMESEYAG